MSAFNDGCKAIKEQVKLINSHLGGNRAWLCLDRLTLADIVAYVALTNAFRLVLDGGFRKAMPHATEWFVKMSKLPTIVRTMGFVKMCEKPVKPVDPSKCVAVPVSEKVAEVKAAPAKKDDDDFDPFADEEDDDAAEAALELKHKAAIAKAGKKVKEVIAKSIVVWEVKPYAAEVDLDFLAKKILAIEMDGLAWKTEYKKEPVAFGVFKLAIGAIVEDLKVSTDDVQEKIEALRVDDSKRKDEDDEEEEDEENFLVQSVDIQSFNKL